MAINRSTRKVVHKGVSRISAEWTEKQPAWLGNYSGVVVTSVSGVIYARLINGKVIRVHNTLNVPLDFDLHIEIGRHKHNPTIWQIIRVIEDYDTPAAGGRLAYHAAQHMFNAPDEVPIDRKQITALTVRVYDGANFIVTLFGDVANTPTGLVQIASQNIDLSAEIPTTGAVFVNIEADDNGTVTTNTGADFGSPFVAALANVPVPGPGKHLLAYVLLFEGQVELLDEHIHVPMPLGMVARGMGLQISEADADAPLDADEFGFWDVTDETLKKIAHSDLVALLTTESGIDSRRYLGVYNYFLGAGPATTYNVAIAASANGRDWNIDDEPVIDLGAGGTWDDGIIKDPKLLMVNGVLYLYYTGYDSTAGGNGKIGLARSFDGGATWTKYASNPVLNNNIAWENTNVTFPVILYDREETDSNKRWKMWYAGSSFGEGIGYAYSADGLSWTKAAGNPVLDLGTSGQWDDAYIIPAAVIRRGSEFVLFYGGNNGSGTWSSGYVTFSDPEGTYTRSANNPILSGDGVTTTLTADLTSGSTTATVSDATVFPIGCPVWIGYATRFLTHVTKRNSATSIELADAAPATIASGQIVRSAAYNSVILSDVRYNDGYQFRLTVFQPDGGTQLGVHELSMIGYANDDLEQIYIDYGAGVQIPVTVAESQNTNASRENLSVLDTYEEEQRHKPAGQSVTFNDGEGDPEDVTSGGAAPGTSEFAARRDHVHHAGGGGVGELVMEDGVTFPPVPITTEDGDDWIYST